VPTLQELLVQRAKILNQITKAEAELVQAQQAQRNEAIAKVRAAMAEAGITLADIDDGSTKRAPAAAIAKTSTVAPKYRDPVSGNTWSGRGLKPRWMTAAIAEGKKPEDFAI
jgi:DNA-binding protein H-NS